MPILIRFELQVGLTSGDGKYHFSKKMIEELLANAPIAYSVIEGRGSEGNHHAIEDNALIVTDLNSPSISGLLNYCNFLPKLVLSIQERLLQRWIKLTCSIYKRSAPTEVFIHQFHEREPTQLPRDKFEQLRASLESGSAFDKENGSSTVEGCTRTSLMQSPHLTFSGYESYAYALLGQILSRDENYIASSVRIKAFDNLTESTSIFKAIPYRGVVDGYFRSLVVNHQDLGIVTVGGNNAKKARFAAKTISISINKAALVDLCHQHSFLKGNVYASQNHAFEVNLEKAVAEQDINAAISVCRNNPTEETAQFLINSLEDTKLKPRNRAFLSDAFRSFEKCCQNNESLSETITGNLCRSIKSSLSCKALALPCIYGIEALGYVSKNNWIAQQQVTKFLTNLLSNEAYRAIHGHDVAWSCVATLERIGQLLTKRELSIVTACCQEAKQERCYPHVMNSLETILRRCTKHGHN